MNMAKRLAAELLGTFWLVLGGCGSAVLAAKFGGDGNPLGIGFVGVALAFGLTVLTGAYAFGHVSGAHFNPAVTVGLFAGGRFPARDVVPYILAQVVGAFWPPGSSCTSPAARPALPSTAARPARLPATATGHCRRAATASQPRSCARSC